MTPKLLDIKNCSRCGGHHDQLRFEMLLHPVYCNAFETMTHWAPCPTNSQPILVGPPYELSQLGYDDETE